MGIAKEKISIIIAIIGLLGVAFTTFLIQYCSNLINDWEIEFLFKQNKLNNIYAVLTNKQAQQQYYTILQMTNEKLTLIDEGIDTTYVSPDLLKLNQSFQNCNISQEQYLKGRKRIAFKNYTQLYNEYNKQFRLAEDFYKKKPTVSFLFNIKCETLITICYVINILSIIVILLLYIKLLNKVRQEIEILKDKNTEK